MKFMVLYLFIISIYGLLIMYIDKKHAIKHQWRTPELKLFIVALCFGSPGIYLGMQLFRHKTKHKKFVILIPLILILQIYILFKLFYWFSPLVVK